MNFKKVLFFSVFAFSNLVAMEEIYKNPLKESENLYDEKASPKSVRFKIGDKVFTNQNIEQKSEVLNLFENLQNILAFSGSMAFIVLADIVIYNKLYELYENSN